MYQRYSDAIFGIVVRIVKRQEEAEEVMQSVFLKIWNNIDSYNEGKATLFTWMAQIARNTAIDKVRLKSYQNADKTSSIADYEYSFAADQPEKSVDLDALTKKLPEKYKVLLDKMFHQGYTQQEISDELEIPLGTVKTRLRDAIQILRSELK
ncbi:MAG: sigma-70 family RNA polymerase sigma factor, partial [Saprospiraceae bacterium]